jgi:hypothetical protein
MVSVRDSSELWVASHSSWFSTLITLEDNSPSSDVIGFERWNMELSLVKRTLFPISRSFWSWQSDGISVGNWNERSMDLSRFELRASKMVVADSIPMTLFLVSVERRGQIQGRDDLNYQTIVTQIHKWNMPYYLVVNTVLMYFTLWVFNKQTTRFQTCGNWLCETIYRINLSDGSQ